MQDKELYCLLRKKVEMALGFKPVSRGDFDRMQKCVFKQTGVQISSTTLRRFWGYQEQKEGYGCSTTTVNTLSVLAGYKDVDDFKNSLDCQCPNMSNSDFVIDCKILVPSELSVGTRVHLTWNPERMVVLRFEGQDVFRVVESVNSKLQVDDVMRCQQFVNGQPLFCKGLIRTGMPTMDYICGKFGGIRYAVE